VATQRGTVRPQNGALLHISLMSFADERSRLHERTSEILPQNRTSPAKAA
jgi:hypothetical protein